MTKKIRYYIKAKTIAGKLNAAIGAINTHEQLEEACSIKDFTEDQLSVLGYICCEGQDTTTDEFKTANPELAALYVSINRQFLPDL